MKVLTRTTARLARAVHEGGLANARTSATECSRRRVERAEVEAFLAGLHERTPAPSALAVH